jgi:hypothetical protein
MPNAFAYLILFGWPLIAVVLFRTLPLHKALIWTLIGGYLILPTATGVKVPMLPTLDKSLIPALSALVLCMVYAPKTTLAPDWAGRTGRVVIAGLIGLLVVTPFLTVVQNPEPLIFGPMFVPGLRLYDAFSMISAIFMPLLPFWIGLRYLNTQEGHKALLQAFVVGALIYTLPALFEVRMSPQLHNWIYGFSPFNFLQQIREDGFRPVVFLNHGLMLGIFLCMAVISALVLWREALREGKTASGWVFAAIWLAIVLVVSKNLGALGIAILMSSLVVFTGRRVQTTFAVCLAVVVILYPMLRGAGLIPVDAVHDLALSVSEERAESLKFRFDNEDALLEHANKKPLFGWGSWGRNQLFEEGTGKMVSVTDGIWVILIGTYGWLGYIAHFGLLTFPILFYALRRRTFGPSLVTPGLIMVLSANLIDLLPNAGLVSYVWLMAGALTGYVLWRPVGTTEPVAPAELSGAGWQSTAPAGSGASWVMAGAASPVRRRTRRADNRRAAD